MTRQRSQSLSRMLYRDATHPYRGASPTKLRRLCTEIMAEGRRPSPLAVFVVDGDVAIETLMAAGLPLLDEDDRGIAASAIRTDVVGGRIADMRAATGEASRLLGILLDGGTGEFPSIRSPVVRVWAAATAAEHAEAPWAMRLLAALAADNLPERPSCGCAGRAGEGSGLPRMDGQVSMSPPRRT